VTVVVSVPGQEEPWKVSKAAFRLLVAEVEQLTDDSEFMVRAAVLNGLHFDLESRPEQLRIASLLADAARNLRGRLLSLAEPTPWDLGLANYLPVLEMWMEGLTDTPL
jgi:hypothetical protein